MIQLTLVLHNIRSTHNVGAIFRTAECLGAHEIIISGYTPYPHHEGDTRLPHIARKLHSQISKTALGAERIVPFTVVDSFESWLATYPGELAALEIDARSVPITMFQPPRQLALLLGEEVAGVSEQHRTLANHLLEIPMRGTKESLNVSIAAGIAVYELLK